MPTTRPAWSKDLATLDELRARSEAQALNLLRQLVEQNGLSVTRDKHRHQPDLGRSLRGVASIVGVIVVIALYVLIVWQLSAAMP